MRSHGWEVPYHPLQTVGMAVFSGISLSFYVFFIPFVGNNIVKYHIYAVFSPVVLAVLLLYVRCAGCDPADPGVHRSNRVARAKQREKLKTMDLISLPNLDTPSGQSHDESERNSTVASPSLCARLLLGLPFACCRKDESPKLQVGELLLYCSICEAKISRNSKHCKACDKCVQEFDHHCRWLNNCVGKRNYKTFVALMVAGLLLLIMVWTTGIGVLVRCFTHKTSFDQELLHRLGSSFSRIPYIVTVFVVSMLAMLGTMPLCQLFFFHLILIHKGITTYDYILATREQGDGFNSLPSSPTSSNSTGVSGQSSAEALALHGGVFCTPPRMFVQEHQQEVLAITGDEESTSTPKAGKSKAHRRSSVGINPWKLAKLNAAKAITVAAQARESSANIRPTALPTEDSSLESSRDVSGEIPMRETLRHSTLPLGSLTAKEKWLLLKDSSLTPPPETAHAIIPPPTVALPPTITIPPPLDPSASPNRLSGSSYQSCSPDEAVVATTIIPVPMVLTDSGGSSDEERVEKVTVVSLRKSDLDSSIVTPCEKVAVWEDGAHERVDRGRTNSTGRSSDSGSSVDSMDECSSGSRAEANILKHVRKEWPELRRKLSASPGDSNGSFPSPFYTPLQEPPLQINEAPATRPLPLLVSASKMFKASMSVGKTNLAKLAS